MTHEANTSSNPAKAKSYRDEALTPSEFIDYVGDEIHHLRSQVEQPGWTMWALLAAFAGTTWLTLDLLGSARINSQSSLLLLLLAFALEDALSFLSSLLSFDAPAYPRPTIIFSSRLASAGRLRILALTFRYLLVIGLASSLEFSSTARLLYFISYVPLLLLTILMLPLSFFHVPLPSRANPYPGIGAALFGFFFIATSLSALFLGASIAAPATRPAVPDAQLSALLFAAMYIAVALSGSRERLRTISGLAAIRQELAVGNIDLAFARKQVDVLLAGFEVSDLLQRDVDKILGHLRDASRALSEVSARITALSSELPSSAVQLTEDQERLGTAVMESVRPLLDSAQTSMSTARAAAKRFRRQQAILVRIVGRHPSLSLDVNALLGRIDAAADDTATRLKEVEASQERLAARLAKPVAPSTGHSR